MRGAGFLPALFVLTLAFAAAAAPARPQSADQPIKSGTEITRDNTGPDAAGFRDFKSYAGSELRDGKSYAFARSVSAAAAYDGISVEGPHLLIEGASFDGPLDIYTKETVVLRGAVLRPRAKAPMALLVRPGAGPVYVLFSDIGGEGSDINAAIALRGAQATVFRSRIAGGADAVQISGARIRIFESLITTRHALPGDHNDAIQLLGAPDDVEIARNRIANPNPQTSAITILGSRISVRDNHISGGGWSLYGGKDNNGKGNGGATKVEVTGNVFARDIFPKSGHFGPVSYWDARNIWRDNRFDDGAPVPVR